MRAPDSAAFRSNFMAGLMRISKRQNVKILVATNNSVVDLVDSMFDAVLLVTSVLESLVGEC